MSQYQRILAENQFLETTRLALRPVTLQDTEDMFAYASDEACVTFVFPKHLTIEDTKESIATYFMAAPLGKYGIELKENGALIGTIDLRVFEEKNTAELGYTIHRHYWGNGYVAEAASELLKLGFDKLHLMHIFATHDIDNPASGRVMEKIGMSVEGTIKNSRIAKGKIVTDVLRGITIEAWEKRQERTSVKKESTKHKTKNKDN